MIAGIPLTSIDIKSSFSDRGNGSNNDCGSHSCQVVVVEATSVAVAISVAAVKK